MDKQSLLLRNKTYDPKKVEGPIYSFWLKNGYFTPKIDKKKKPFTILLPLPNANDSIHMGHALFTVEDIMARYHRMLGEPTLWLPGADHAGIETQFVFEKKLVEEGGSRFDFASKTLYQMIADFVEENRTINQDQLKRLGFSLDWKRYHYSLEPQIIKTVLQTFKKLHQDGLVYRGERIVNFCIKCGTAFSDLEVDYQEKDALLYFLNYGPIQIATTRPETIFADVAVAVNPKDKRYQKLIGISAELPLVFRKLPIIADELVDTKFGTGALKITPAHDPTDFEIGQKNNLEIISVIDRSDKMVNVPEKYLGMTVKKARKEVVKDLQQAGKLVKTEPLKHSVGICYRCGTVIEPMLMPQWFVKTKPLAEPAIKAVKEGKTKIVPKKRFEKMYFDWLENIHDWNISRQIVWGPQIPVWYCLDCNPKISINFISKGGEKISGLYRGLKEKYPFGEIESGLQSLVVNKDPLYQLEQGNCQKCGGNHVLQETDTFDTWFLSGQWPLTTLGYPHSQDFKYFYPTSVLDTLWDILFFWVGRMMMFGLYLAKEVPFRVIHIHARVVDKYGQKMSKSKGNVVDPIDMVEKYGADALRMALVIGVAPASDIAVSNEKVRGMRNFANKIWNASRFVIGSLNGAEISADQRRNPRQSAIHPDDQWIISETRKTIKSVTKHLDNYRFGQAAEEIYHFFWHTFCDRYIEMTKSRREEAQPTLLFILDSSLRLLHPFIPFITEQVWQIVRRLTSHVSRVTFKEKALIIAPWPK